MPFIYPDGDKNAQYEPTGEFFRGNMIYCVTKAFGYVWDKGGVSIQVPAGFTSDLATIPKLPFLKVLPKAGGTLWDDAAIVHDKACTEAHRKRITYTQADGLFYAALRERGCSKFTATVFWAAVRLLHMTIGKG